MKTVTLPFFISHHGCPHTCIFCDQRTISGSQGALPNAAEILERYAAWRLTAAGRPLEIAFFGGSFSALPDAVQTGLLAPLQPLLQSGELRGVRISTRPDYIDDQRLERLAAQGVRSIELGVQSMDDDVLKASGRGHTAAASEAAIRCIKAHGLQAGAQLMPGLPGDTPAASLESLQRVIAAGADFLRLYPTVVLQGTELARRFAAGQFTPLSLDRGVSLCKLLLQQALLSGIPVIRIGLQADQGLNSQTVLAGCWHPALGQLVRSQLYADLISRQIPDNTQITVACHPERRSDIVGINRCHLQRQRQRGVQMQLVSDAALNKEELIMTYAGTSRVCSIIKDLHYSINEV